MSKKCFLDLDQETSIALVIDNFDFNHVHQCMKAMDCKWYTPHSNAAEIPSIERMKTFATVLLENAVYSGYSISGGFEATYNKSKRCFTLKYVLTRYSNS